MWPDYLLPPLAALLLWWAGTGLVILLDRVPRAWRGAAFGAASLFTLGALACIQASSLRSDVSAAYAGFVCALALWGWHELAFLGGRITGPRRVPATPGATGLRRLWEALAVLLWHELALIASGIALWAWLAAAPNRTAAWTFTLLYVMRVSAKLNLYLGVRNVALEFLPARLLYLGSYFRQRPFNLLMPWSLVAGAAMVGLLLAGAQSTLGGVRAMHLLLASLLVLALLEHLMMVLPLQPDRLWRWALRRDAVRAG